MSSPEGRPLAAAPTVVSPRFTLALDSATTQPAHYWVPHPRRPMTQPTRRAEIQTLPDGPEPQR